MKTILIAASAAALVLCSASCRLAVPVNPNTGELDSSMVPEGNHPSGFYNLNKYDKKTEVKPSK